MVVSSSDEEGEDFMATRDGVPDDFYQAFAAVTKQFKKRYFKARPTNNNLRTSSTSAFPKKDQYNFKTFEQ